METRRFGNPSGGTELEAQRVTLRSFYPELGTVSSFTETEAWSVDLGLDVSLTDNWNLEIGAAYSNSDYDFASRGRLDLYQAAQNEIFNPWGDGTGNINDPYSWDRSARQTRSTERFAIISGAKATASPGPGTTT